MPWPDIFFKSRKPKPEAGGPPAFPSVADASKPPMPPDVPTIKPIPTSLGTRAIPKPLLKIGTPDTGTGTRTLPAMHGVILRPPGRLNTTTQISPLGTPPAPPEPIKNIEQLMAEADPVQALSQSGNVTLKRFPPGTEPVGPSDPPPPPTPPPMPATEPSSIKADPALPGTSASGTMPTIPPPPPPTPLAAADRRPLQIPAPSPFATTKSIRDPRQGNTPFILKPTVSLASTRKAGSPNPPPMIPIPLGSIIRRKANMADVARLVLPPKRDETEPLPPPPVSAPTVVPPSFSVAGTLARPVPDDAPNYPQPLPEPIPVTAQENPFLEKAEPTPIAAETVSSTPTEIKSYIVPEPEKQAEMSSLFAEPPKVDPEAHKPEPTVDPTPKLDPEAHKETPVIAPEPPELVEPVLIESPAPTPPNIAEPLPETAPHIVEPPIVDPETHRPEPAVASALQLDPEAPKETPVAAPEPPKAEVAPAEPVTVEPTPEPGKELVPVKEKREFHLTNGEKVAGVVLSETPEAVYIEHGTLGVVTIPRNEIAKRLVEIILINGDRIVGDIMAETADMIYVRHASLGMLSVPRTQRSVRVVEAILTDGDRILGEILTETDTFTVIKSATLGTVTVPHNKVAMLNRKIEQIELKALPMSMPVPELKG
jgi:RNase P/RNase MRP subunit p29